MVFTVGLVALVASQLPAPLVSAAPVVETLEARAGVTAVSAATIASLTPYAQFSRAAYCGTSVASWSCGEACNSLPGFVPYVTGGDGASTPYWFVGYWPTDKTVVVVHEGTDPTELESVLTDAEVLLVSLSTSLFPGVSSSVQVHDGFASAHSRSASKVLAAVKQVMSARSVTKVTLVGHSLGAAISTIEMLYLKLNLPSTTTFKFVGHGSPRVGNQDFANYIDSHFTDVTRVTNDNDLIPIVPGRFLGYHHISGEKHIDDDGNWVACTGQDNTDTRCSTGNVPTIFEGNIVDHLGPYNGVWIGTIFCY